MSIEEFQVIILAGGFGKHLTPLADHTPKALIPVANRPLLSYQLEMLESAGFSSMCYFRNTTINKRINYSNVHQPSHSLHRFDQAQAHNFFV